MKKKYKFNPTRGLYDWRSAKHASVEFLNKIRETFDDDEDRTYKKFLDIMGDIGGNRTEIDRVFEEVTKVFKDEPSLFIEFSRFLSYETKANRAQEDGSESIDWISEKSCFRRNPYEKNMFECEDDRFEMDMLLCHLASDHDDSEKLAWEYLKKPNWFGNSITIIKKYLKIHDLRCSDEMIELFKLNPIDVAKEILLPQKMKIQEATKLRSKLRQMEKACLYVDHRYFRRRKVPNNPKYANCWKFVNKCGSKIPL
ncbi:SIN3-like 1 [Actinidia rufa]|uniref:SIN3-like 1 n=1 Tax=Actinidia rufa TaxID=165716 RepID=A0A7J0D979_9ERIC|nr:SIN3-like 1 [Actinidia rufa]